MSTYVGGLDSYLGHVLCAQRLLQPPVISPPELHVLRHHRSSFPLCQLRDNLDGFSDWQVCVN
ncbi:hypothetical protein GBAR_LOCUS29687, partial [Geodia barretti]